MAQDSGTPNDQLLSDAAGMVARLYAAALGRDVDADGHAFWQQQLESGVGLNELANLFLGSLEFQSRFGTDLDDDGYLDRMYQNVLGRNGDDNGKAFWKQQLAGGMSRQEVLVQFSESGENKAATARRVGGDGDDEVVGDDGDNGLVGGDGNDTMIGLGGDDRLIGGDGDDVLYGGGEAPAADEDAPAEDEGTATEDDAETTTSGATVAAADDGTTGETSDDAAADEESGTDDESTTAPDGDDRLIGGDGDDTLIGGTGADWLTPGDGADTLVFAAGDSTAEESPMERSWDLVNGFNATGNDEGDDDEDDEDDESEDEDEDEGEDDEAGTVAEEKPNGKKGDGDESDEDEDEDVDLSDEAGSDDEAGAAIVGDRFDIGYEVADEDFNLTYVHGKRAGITSKSMADQFDALVEMLNAADGDSFLGANSVQVFINRGFSGSGNLNGTFVFFDQNGEDGWQYGEDGVVELKGNKKDMSAANFVGGGDGEATGDETATGTTYTFAAGDGPADSPATIATFEVGLDQIDLTALGLSGGAVFSFTAAPTSGDADAFATAAIGVHDDGADSTVYVDANGDGAFDASAGDDLVIRLTGVTGSVPGDDSFIV